MPGWLHHPLVHFALAGAALFGADRWLWRRTPHAARAPIVISARRVADLESDYAQRWNRRPTRAELDALVDEAVEDELLYREARALRLDAGDPAVRARLVQKMRAVSDDPSLSEEALFQAALSLGFDDDVVVRRILREKLRLGLQRSVPDEPPSEGELRAYLESHRDRFARAPALSFEHVFLSPTARGGRLARDAEACLRTLRDGRPSPERIAALSDPFTLGREFHAMERAEIARFFGEGFAARLDELPVGVWSGPLSSPFGVHLVRIEEKLPERAPSLEAVRQQISRSVIEDRAARRLRENMKRLRALYAITIERPDVAGHVASR